MKIAAGGLVAMETGPSPSTGRQVGLIINQHIVLHLDVAAFEMMRKHHYWVTAGAYCSRAEYISAH